MTIASISQDLHRLIRRVGTLTNKQASVCEVDWDDQPVDRFWVDIKPNSGYYEGGIFRFKVISCGRDGFLQTGVLLWMGFLFV